MNDSADLLPRRFLSAAERVRPALDSLTREET